LVLRSGQPAPVLDQMAVEDGYGLVVVGARGAGLSTVLLGSVATRLAAQASVPARDALLRICGGRGLDQRPAPDEPDFVVDDFFEDLLIDVGGP
jgi:hypothetical protein